MLPIKFELFRLAEKREIIFLVFHTKASKFSRERYVGFTADKYVENHNLNLRLSSWDFITKILSVNSFNWYF